MLSKALSNILLRKSAAVSPTARIATVPDKHYSPRNKFSPLSGTKQSPDPWSQQQIAHDVLTSTKPLHASLYIWVMITPRQLPLTVALQLFSLFARPAPTSVVKF
jgi:hypothetical protein